MSNASGVHAPSVRKEFQLRLSMKARSPSQSLSTKTLRLLRENELVTSYNESPLFCE